MGSRHQSFGDWFLEVPYGHWVCQATGADWRGAGTHLASTALHDVLRGVINLRLHVNILVFLMIHLHPQNSKERPAKIQGNEISLFCLRGQQGSFQIQVLPEGPMLCPLLGFGPPSSHLPLCFWPESRSHPNTALSGRVGKRNPFPALGEPPLSSPALNFGGMEY